MKHLKFFERYFDLNDPIGQPLTYEILYEFGKPKAIKCLKCNMTSYNPNDIEHKYCGKCEEFHHDTEESSNLPSDMYHGKGPNLDEEPLKDDDEFSNLPSDMYHGKGPNLDEDEEDIEDETEGVTVELLDDLKANFRSWETDCDTQHDFNSLCAIMMDRHPNVEPDEIATVCADWIGFKINNIE